MGKATQLFKSLFGLKNRKEKKGSPNSGDSSAVFCHNPATIPPNITATEAAWLRSAEKEQNKHAIAFAAASAAADAAVSAAEAAVAVVRLAGQGRGTPSVNRGYIWAAVKIQSAFRGYLCRKALRAMRGVVKLQALVRGILVRKQANATLHGMEALIRAQSILRAQKFQGHFHHNHNFRKVKKRCNGRRYSSSFDTKMTFYEKPMMVEVGLGWPESRSRRSNNSVSESSDDLFCAIHWNNPAQRSAPDSRSHYFPGWDLTGDGCHFSTAQSTPCFVNGPSRFANRPNGPLTPGLCSTTFPNYMADTQSFRAKLRSRSAPRQKPDIGPKNRQSLLSELMEGRNSHSGARLQRSCSQTQAFKNAVMCKLERFGDSVRGREEESFLGRKS